MKTYVYFHVCCLNNWKEIFTNLFNDIKNSGLYNKIDKIKVNVLTTNNDDLLFFNDEKIEIISNDSNLILYEKSTLNLLYEHALIEDFNVLYIHTKGIRHYGTKKYINVKDWVDYLSYFNIYKHDLCLEKLESNDCVGVNLQNYPQTHYSGNFWWLKFRTY